jgi:hypothetical protein
VTPVPDEPRQSDSNPPHISQSILNQVAAQSIQIGDITQTNVYHRANRGGEPKRSFDEKLKVVSGVLSILIGLLALVPQVGENLSKAIEAFVKLPPFVWLFAAVILLIVGFFALLDGLSRRSRLLRPDALLLQVDQPRHLKGRLEDINQLSTLCNDSQQVHLVGDSGVGKSALIQAGLCQVLKSSRGLFPIHLNVWGQDWETGPRTGLTMALWEVLSEDECRTLGLTEFPAADQLALILGQFKRKLGRTPLLIFDQFDDYQTRHRTQFLPGRRRTWIPAAKLLETNAFWRDIKNLMDIQAVHCLFATRRDSADGLESIRFARPEVYWLERLHEGFVLPLLTELTADVSGENPVVSAPERGWKRLKDRLARNLCYDGTALPAQMKIILQGLASLPSLTVRDYERVGGLQGLEATHIERQIANTAYNSRLTVMQVRKVLVALADAETFKTVPRSTQDLKDIITTVDYQSDGSRLKQATEDALDDLEKKELVRKRLDPDTRQHMWLLDHDYLCRGVLEVERRANRWSALAQEGARAFHDAGHYPWRKWQTLLNPWQQIVLAIQRLRGRFRYADLRVYALWSLLRFVPYLLVLATISVGWTQWTQWQQAERIRNVAGQIRDVIGLSGTLSSIELDSLWKLAHSDDAVHDSFLRQSLASPARAEQFSRRIDMTIQAMVGLNPGKREAIRKHVERLCLEHPAAEPFIKRVCVRIGIALAEEKPTFTRFAVKTLVEDIAKATDAEQLRALAEALKAVRGQLPVAEAQQAYTAILAEIATTRDFFQLRALAEALKAVPGQLPVAEAQQAYTAILAEIATTTDVRQLRALVEALKAVLSPLPVAEAQQAYAAVLAEIAKATDAEPLRALAEALKAVRGPLPVAEAQQAYTAILAKMATLTDVRRQWATPTDFFQLRALAEALQAVMSHIPAAGVQQAYTAILAKMAWATSSWQLETLAEALKAVLSQLPVAEAQQAYTAILAEMATPRNFFQLETLAEALKAVLSQLPVAGAQQAYTAILAEIAKATDAGQLRALAEALKAVPGQLPVAGAQQAYTAILAEIAKATDAGQLRALAEALKAVPGQLPVAGAEQAYTAILAEMATTKGSWQLWSKTRDFFQLRALTEALKAVPGQLPVAGAEQAYTAILAEIAKATDRDAEPLRALAEALKAVLSPLPVAGAQQAYTAILAEIVKTTDARQLETLTEALKTVPGQLERQKLIDLLKWPVSIKAFRAFSLGMLEQQLGRTFDGNLWEMVAWAQKNHLDVEHPPQIPSIIENRIRR